MLIEIVISLIIGILLGIITGLTPGIHVNLISALMLSLAPIILTISTPITLILIILAMAVTHTFLDSIPSTYLGAPDEESSLTVLPAHRMLLKGNGYQAIKLFSIGSYLGLIITILLTPLIIYLSTNYYEYLKQYIVYILIASVIFLIIKEKGNKTKALLVIALAAGLGILTLNFPNLDEPLFPMLSGLFGTSTLLISLKDKIKIPIQKIENYIKISKKETAKVMTSSTLVSLVAGFIPGIASSQSAILASTPFKKIDSKYFILMVGSINTIIMILSFSALYTIQKARNGAVITISKIIENVTLNHLMVFLAATLFVGGIAFILSLKLAKGFSKHITKFHYQNICIIILITITALTILLSGYIGLLILIISTAIGTLPTFFNVGKNHLMSCLLIPIILFFIL